MPSNYTSIVWTITDDLKELLSKPFGKVCSTEEYARLLSEKNMLNVITVGDVVSSTALSYGYTPKIMVVDQKTKREGFNYDWAQFNPTTVWNPPGTISLNTFIVLTMLLQKPERSVLLVDGEEDLLALAALIICPIGYTIFYGQPNEGVVCVEIDKAKRLVALDIFSKMVVKEYE